MARTNPEMGVSNTYQKVSIKYIKHDLAPWVDMCKKYGLPSITAPFCTEKMKTIPSKKYCDEVFGENNYTLYLGMRVDEPTRLKPKPNVVYLAELSDFDKGDILEWWSEQPFNLNIPEHLGNCVFA